MLEGHSHSAIFSPYLSGNRNGQLHLARGSPALGSSGLRDITTGRCSQKQKPGNLVFNSPGYSPAWTTHPDHAPVKSFKKSRQPPSAARGGCKLLPDTPIVPLAAPLLCPRELRCPWQGCRDNCQHHKRVDKPLRGTTVLPCSPGSLKRSHCLMKWEKKAPPKCPFCLRHTLQRHTGTWVQAGHSPQWQSMALKREVIKL